jgi:MFS transporter, OPA family, phosphoglycerate transporter protein
MLDFLKSRPAAEAVPEADIAAAYYRLRIRALIGVFIGYAAYYFVRANFTLSTPYLMKAMALSKTDIGLLSSAMLVTYGVSKGIMSSLADKCNPKYYMILGLLLSCMVNLMLGFSTAFWMFLGLVILNGLFQGMGVGPAYITLASWFPRLQRGRIGAAWNISHNVGGGMVAPIAVGAFALFGAEHWQAASYWAPAALAALVAVVFMLVGVGTTYNAGLPPVNRILKGSGDEELVNSAVDHAPENMSAFQIFYRYVLPNKSAWYISLVDACIYLVRFGVITWLPIYLLQTKGFTKEQMGLAFAVFEWAAIPSTLLAGFVSDKFLKGRRMPVAIACMLVILASLFVYWTGESIVVVTVAAGAIGAFIYVPQFMASIAAMEIVPPFAVGSVTGLRGFMSYVVGSTIGTALIGKMVDLYGWSAGFYTLLTGAVLCIAFCFLAHKEMLMLERSRAANASEDRGATLLPQSK